MPRRVPAVGLRARIALAGGLVVFAVLLTASLVVYPLADRNLHDQLDSSLVATTATAPKFADLLKNKLTSGAYGKDASAPIAVGDTLIQFLDGSRIALVPGEPVEIAPISKTDVAVANGDQPAYFHTVSYLNQNFRVYTALYGDTGSLVRVARPEGVAVSSLDRLRYLLIALVIGGAVIAALAARLLAGRVLRPVRRLTETVERVTVTQDLTTRIDTGGRDEIGRLAKSFSAMMTALDVSVDQQKRLVADASHELRTPLTSLTTNLELLAEDGGLADPQAPELLRRAREQSLELRVLINDLIDLSRYGEAETHREELRLDLLADEVVTRAAKRAPHLSFVTDLDECLVDADADAISRALGNLVDNAVKWSPDGGTVRVAVGAVPKSDRVAFTVADEGPGIPPDDLPHVFDRFYRSVAARSKPGSGLGLSIVRQIADTHGGEVDAHPRSPGPGVELRFVLPRSNRPDAGARDEPDTGIRR